MGVKESQGLLCPFCPIGSHAMLQIGRLICCRSFSDMVRFFHTKVPTTNCNPPWLRLACPFFTGLVLGAFFSVLSGVRSFLWLPDAIVSCSFLAGHILAIGFPFILSGFAVYVGFDYLLIPLAFSKAFLFSFLFVGIFNAFGAAGWLMVCFLMFPDALLLPVLWWFWIDTALLHRGLNAGNLCISTLFIMIVGSLDYFVITPFVINLIS